MVGIGLVAVEVDTTAVVVDKIAEVGMGIHFAAVVYKAGMVAAACIGLAAVV